MTDVYLYSLTKTYNRLSLFPEKHAEIEDDDFIRDAKAFDTLRYGTDRNESFTYQR